MKLAVTSESLRPYLFGSLAWSGIAETDRDLRDERWLGAYRRVLSEGFYHLPFFLVRDWLRLLTGGQEIRFRSEERSASAEPSDRRCRAIRYERECLGRMLQSADIAAAREIALTSSRPEACLERLLIQLAKRLAPHYPDSIELNPGMLRDFEVPSLAEVDPAACEAAFIDQTGLDDPFGQALDIFLANLSERVRWGQLLHQEDLFELGHLEALPTDHLRVGCRQVIEVSRRLADSHPRPLDLKPTEADADTAFLDETHFPSGGLSGLTNRGSLESLVSSELAYLDEGAGGVSLFDLRHVEGELLYHLRDSGNLRRKRRTIHFILDPGTVFDRKPVGYDYQYSVLIQGLCLRLLGDLFDLFDQDAVRFEFHYLSTGTAPEALDAEIGIMRTVLIDDVKHGRVRLTIHQGGAIDLDAFVDPSRKSYAVIFAGPRRAETWQSAIELSRADGTPLSAVLVSVDSDNEEFSPLRITLPKTGLPIGQIGERKNAVLEALVG